MRSKTLGQLYADLGVTKTHSRPHVSNDNPFSESQFKTLKYRPGFPKRFGSQEHARDCSRDLIDWYNNEHHHSALGWLTPRDVHYGLAEQRLAARAAVMEKAYLAHPERFVHGPPRLAGLARAVWINPPNQGVSASTHPESEPPAEHPSALARTSLTAPSAGAVNSAEGATQWAKRSEAGLLPQALREDPRARADATVAPAH